MSQVFQFFLSCLQQVFKLLKNVKIDNGLNYLDLIIWVALVGLLLEILKFVRGDIASEEKFLKNKKMNEEYREYVNTLKRYEQERQKGSDVK